MHYKDHLPVIRRDDLCTLQECLVTKIKSEGGRTYAGGGGVNEKRTGAYKGGGGSEMINLKIFPKILISCYLISMI